MNKPDRILVLFASPNKTGFTNSLLNIYLEDLKNRIHNSCQVDYIYIYEHEYLPCYGCDRCKKTGICYLNKKDGYGELLESISKTNYIIIASPVYFNGFPAPLKALIDRAQQRYSVKFADGKRQYNKKMNRGALIASCGANTTKFFKPLSDTTRMFFDCLDIAFTDKLFASNTDDPHNIKISDSFD